jgi:hypothetical protein
MSNDLLASIDIVEEPDMDMVNWIRQPEDGDVCILNDRIGLTS